MKVQWSYSGLKDFETCARKYHEVKVLKLYPRQETEATLYGTRLHEAAEFYIRDGTPLPNEFKFVKATLDALNAMPGRKLCEHEMALREDLSACDFKDPDYWVRGIADLVIVDDDNFTARVFDYKTGSDKYPDPGQLDLMALMIMAEMPHIKRVTGGLLFVKTGRLVKHSVDREEIDRAWWRYRERAARIGRAHETGVWNPTSSGLCKKYCPCTGCEFNGSHR